MALAYLHKLFDYLSVKGWEWSRDNIRTRAFYLLLVSFAVSRTLLIPRFGIVEKAINSTK
jgi:hypothetical protein